MSSTGPNRNRRLRQPVREAQARLSDIKTDLTAPALAVKSHVRVGDPTEMTLSVATEDNVSLIAMSAYGTDRVPGDAGREHDLYGGAENTQTRPGRPCRVLEGT